MLLNSALKNEQREREREKILRCNFPSPTQGVTPPLALK